MRSCLSLVVFAVAVAANLQPLDRRRARLTVPGAHVGGHGSSEIAEKINSALRAGSTPLRDCSSFARSELNELLRKLLKRRSPELARVYRDRAEGDLRRLRFDTIAQYERSWAEEGDAPNNSPVHEGKCMEVNMIHAHHLSKIDRDELSKSITLPLVPEYRTEHAAVSQTYASQASCVTGHNMTNKITNDHVWPHWPEEVHYYATGYDAYPFWLGGEGEGGHGPLEVWWSEKKAAEKFYHKSCAMDEAGYSANTPCYNMFVGAQPWTQAWLWTAKEDFCCLSGPGTGSPKNWCYMKKSAEGKTSKDGVTACIPNGAGNCTFTANTDVQNNAGGSAVGVDSKEECCAKCSADSSCKAAAFVAATPGLRLSAPQGNFMDTMPYVGTGDLTTPYHSGKVKKYEISNAAGPVQFFWYYTDMNDRPVEQGEGGKGPGIAIHHDYNTSSFKATALDDSIFAVPDICKKTTTSCNFPAGSPVSVSSK